MQVCLPVGFEGSFVEAKAVEGESVFGEVWGEREVNKESPLCFLAAGISAVLLVMYFENVWLVGLFSLVVLVSVVLGLESDEPDGVQSA